MPNHSSNTDLAGTPWKWPDYVFPAAVFLVQFIAFTYLGSKRLIDSDEGFYLYISKLITHGGTIPYRDVFYQQMPLLPYLYGAWMKVFGFSWEAGRSLSAALAALTGTLVFGHIRRVSKTVWLPLCTVILYAFNISVLLFFLTAKTYALSTVCLLGSLLVGTNIKDSKAAGWRAGISGLLLACSIQTRLFFAVAVPVLGSWFWMSRAEGEHHKHFWRFLQGFAAGLIPSLILFGIAPSQFLYDNLLYHGMRDPAGLIGDLNQKLQVATKLIISTSGFHPTQFFFLLCGLVSSLVFWKKITEVARISAVISIVLGIVSFLPTPTFGQYFCVLIPFLAICLTESVATILSHMSSLVSRRLLAGVFVVFSIAYAAAATPRIGSLFFRGEGVPGIDPHTNPNDWAISTVKSVAEVIESNATHDSLVVSSWPGYLLTIDRMIYPEMENQIAIDTSSKLSSEEAHNFRMFRQEKLLPAMADSRVQVVVAGNCTHGRRTVYRTAALANNYKLAMHIGNAEIFVRQPSLSSGVTWQRLKHLHLAQGG